MWLNTQEAPPRVLVVTGAPGTGKSTALESVLAAALAAGAEILRFDGRLEPIDPPRLVAILGARGWMETGSQPTQTQAAVWTTPAVKRILVVDHAEESSQTVAWLTDRRTAAQIPPNVMLIAATRRRVQAAGAEVIHLCARPPEDAQDQNMGFPGLIQPMDGAQRFSAEAALADALLSGAPSLLEALCLVEAATPDAIAAIAGQVIPREAYATLCDCSWVQYRGRWLALEGAAAAVIRRDFAASAPERYAQWLKRAGDRAAKGWYELTPPQGVWLAAALGAAAAAGKPESAPVRLPNAWEWHVVRHGEGGTAPRGLTWPADWPGPVWVVRDRHGDGVAAGAWVPSSDSSATGRVDAQLTLSAGCSDGLRLQMARLMAAALVVDLLASSGMGWVSRESPAWGEVAALTRGTPLLAEEGDRGIGIDCRSVTPAEWLSAMVSPEPREAAQMFPPITEAAVRSALRGFHRVSYLNDLARDHRLGMGGKAFQDLMLGILVAADAPSPLTLEHQRLLRVTYVEKPGTADAIATRLAISRTTYYRQLADAHERMAEALMSVVRDSATTHDE